MADQVVATAMEDNVSIKSSDSVTTSGEYEIVSELLDCPTATGSAAAAAAAAGQSSAVGGGGASTSRETTGAAGLASAAPAKPASRSPTLRIANNGDHTELEKNMHEVIHDLDAVQLKPAAATALPPQKLPIGEARRKQRIKRRRRWSLTSTGDLRLSASCSDLDATALPITAATPQPPVFVCSSAATDAAGSCGQSPVVETPGNKVGQSVFYDCIDLSPMAEKQDTMKADRSSDTDEEMSEIDQDCTIFAGVTYLGAATINAPKSEVEILRNMAELNATSTATVGCGMKVSISIPVCSEGLVVLYDAASNAVMAHYEVHRILFYARGPIDTEYQACFAFTWSHGDSQESAVYQCHIFKCLIPEAVTQVSACFSKAFHRLPATASLAGSLHLPCQTSPGGDDPMLASGAMATSMSGTAAALASDLAGQPTPSTAQYEFIVSLEIREKVAKNAYSAVVRDRGTFRLRCNTDKEINIAVRLSPPARLPPLTIERCFGVLLSPGKLVRQADMQLLDMVTMGYQRPASAAASTDAAGQQCLQPYVIRAEWKSSDKNFERLNAETAKLMITVAVDLVIKGIQEPVRFVLETPVTIQAYNEFLFMKYLSSGGGKRSMVQRFYLQLRDSGDGGWEVSSIDPSDEIVDQAAAASAQSTAAAALQSQSQSLLRQFGFTKMVRSASLASAQFEDEAAAGALSDEDSGGDEPLLSGTGEVSRDCSQDTLDEWGPVLQEWDGEKRPKALLALVRLGVPEALRGKVWQRLANVENRTDMTDAYRVLLTKDTKCETVILSDIHRTFPAHKFFRESGGAGQDSLFKVSKAYAVYDQEVGYCQGLSFVAATLLLHMPEEEAFCVLVSLMYDYGLRDLYKDGFENLYLRLYQLNRLMKEQLPKLYEHFAAIGIETHMFASQWFLTLFTARFPLYFVFHILDVFLLDGMPILFQVALSLLAVCEPELRQLDFEGVLKYVRVSLPKKCRSPAQARRMMKMAVERKVKKLRQYEEEFVANKEATDKQSQVIKLCEAKFNEERQKLRADRIVLQAKYDEYVAKSEVERAKSASILVDYKGIIQRQEQQLAETSQVLADLKRSTASCLSCSAKLRDYEASPLHAIRTAQKDQVDAPLGPLDPLNVALQRVRELELELAQTKLAHVEAECKNQDLNHQLSTTLTEIQSNRNSSGSWQPWLSKTFNSIQEKVATRRDMPTFQSYTGPVGQQQPDVPTPVTPGTAVATVPIAAASSVQVQIREHQQQHAGNKRLQSTGSISNRLELGKAEVALQTHPTRSSLK